MGGTAVVISREELKERLDWLVANGKLLEAQRLEQRTTFDLDGKPAGEVTKEQREHAATLLKERFAAVAKQQREKREAEEAERRRDEKLKQLMSKFGR